MSADAELQLANGDPGRPLTVVVEDLAYGSKQRIVKLSSAAGSHASASIVIESARTFGWHDLRIRVEDAPHFEQRYAGHIETGRESFSDSCIGRANQHGSNF